MSYPHPVREADNHTALRLLRQRMTTDVVAARLGITTGALEARVRKMGFTVRELRGEPQPGTNMDYVERRRAADAAKPQRKCLRCRNTFPSSGPGHRMCGRCRYEAPAQDSPYAL